MSGNEELENNEVMKLFLNSSLAKILKETIISL